jgi:uncharacterized protein (DUF849 family)
MISQASNGYWEILWDERLKGMEAGTEMCTLDATTIIASLDDKELLMSTPPTRCRQLATAMRDRDIKLEWEVFSPTHILQDITALIQAGLDEPPYLVNFVLGVHRAFKSLRSGIDQ